MKKIVGALWKYPRWQMANTPQFIWTICPHWPIIWDIFERKSHHLSIVNARNHKFQLLHSFFGRNLKKSTDL